VTSAQPVPPAVLRPRQVQASILAALQLVEDARHLGSDRRPHRNRVRLLALRAVADRKLARDLRAG
jgi:hypothetical protein